MKMKIAYDVKNTQNAAQSALRIECALIRQFRAANLDSFESDASISNVSTIVTFRMALD